MQGRKKIPKQRDTTELPGRGSLGTFWMHCKRGRRCGRAPYDKLLANPVFRADYRGRRHKRSTAGQRWEIANLVFKVRIVKAQPPSLELMAARREAPKAKDTAKLPGGGKLGLFWSNCKLRSVCSRPPYNRLLGNHVLRTAYRDHTNAGMRQRSLDRKCL